MKPPRDPQDEHEQETAFWLLLLIGLLVAGGVLITFGLFFWHD